MHVRLLSAAVVAAACFGPMSSQVAAAPDNANTLRFVLTCDSGDVWNASFNGGPAVFHLEGGGLFIWRELAYVTPDGISGTLSRGGQGASTAETVTCTYTGAESGNAFTATGVYAPGD